MTTNPANPNSKRFKQVFVNDADRPADFKDIAPGRLKLKHFRINRMILRATDQVIYIDSEGTPYYLKNNLGSLGPIKNDTLVTKIAEGLQIIEQSRPSGKYENHVRAEYHKILAGSLTWNMSEADRRRLEELDWFANEQLDAWEFEMPDQYDAPFAYK